MTDILARGGSFFLAAVILFLAMRLHGKGSGKGEKVAKAAATVMAFCAGLCFLATFVGGWMAKVAGISPYIAGALFLLAAGGLVIDWWRDGKPDKFAFWCAALLPLAAVYGFTQVANAGDLIDQQGERVSSTVSSGGR